MNEKIKCIFGELSRICDELKEVIIESQDEKATTEPGSEKTTVDLRDLK